MGKKKEEAISPELQQAKESLEGALDVPGASENPHVVAVLVRVDQLQKRLDKIADIMRQHYGVEI